MSSFAARLHLPGQTKIPSSVEIDVTSDRVVLSSGRQQLADWLLDEIDVAVRVDGFHIKVDDEEMVINVTDAARLAHALGVSPADPTSSGLGGTNGSIRQLNSASTTLLRYEETKGRIDELAECLTSDVVPPEQVFSRWLKLLKEINRRHGDGSMPLHHFHDLNTQLLDLIPEPTSLP